MNKPKVITQIEKIIDRELHLAPIREGSLLDGLMPYKRDEAKYALDGNRLIGLNLACIGLTDDQWQHITELDGFHAEDIKGLSLSENKLTEFRLPQGMKNIERLYIDANPLTFPAEEITKQGNEATLRFLKEILTQGERDVYEVKMLIVGEGETGKTTFWHKLQNMDYPVPLPLEKQPSTVGIEIKEGWKFEHRKHQGVPFLVNLWDFGGQPIQHMTHQFFLTRRSFYVLLADGRRDVANFSYWFKIIDLLGCDPKQEEPLPVLVVLNKKGVANPPLPYDPEEAKKAFPRLNIINYEVDFAKKDFQLENLPSTIESILCQELPHLPLTIPTNWDDVRAELYSIRKTKEQPEGLDHISLAKLKAICKRHGITDKQKVKDLSQLLHDLGVILHHQDDVRLRNFIVLNPDWAVNAVYEVLRHEEVGENQGRFDQQLLTRIWDACEYSDEEQGNLLGLMLKDSFEVCFEAEEDGKQIYIAPQLLPEFRPKFAWNPGKQTLRYTFQYPFMPKGLIGRLIVRLHEYLKSEAGQKIVWVKGMLLAKDGCEALVIEKEDENTGGKIIQIEVQGVNAEDRRFFLRTIREELAKIHRRSFPSLAFKEKIPCGCSLCLESDKPEFYDLSNLERRVVLKQATVECKQSFENVSVESLLNGVYGDERTAVLHPIKKRIAKGELKEALADLLTALPKSEQNLVIGLQARLQEIERQTNLGITDGNTKREQNQILISALNLCDEIKR